MAVPLWLIIFFAVVIVISVIIILVLALFTDTFIPKTEVEQPGPIGSSCKTSNGCDSGLVCDNGICLKETGSICENSSECNRGALCDGGVCKSKIDGFCNTTDDCLTGLTCSQRDQLCKKSSGDPCLADTECVHECADNNVCASGVLESCSLGTLPCGEGLKCSGTDALCRLERGGLCTTDNECFKNGTETGLPFLAGKDQVCLNGQCQGVLGTYCPDGSQDCSAGHQCKDIFPPTWKECKLLSGQSCTIGDECFGGICKQGICL